MPMSWTDERIEALRTMWEAGRTASQIAEELGGVSRNAVIGKAHRLNLQARPSPVRPNEASGGEPVAIEPDSILAAAPEPEPEAEAEPVAVLAVEAEPEPAPEPTLAEAAPPVPEPKRTPEPILRSVGPGGFVRQAPGEQQPPIAPAPPRRLVPAKPAPEIAGKTTLLDLNDRVCKWPLGHPGEPDFHFCGDKVNPGFPYCVAHCGHAYQAQLPRRDRRAPPPLPFGGPRVR